MHYHKSKRCGCTVEQIILINKGNPLNTMDVVKEVFLKLKNSSMTRNFHEYGLPKFSNNAKVCREYFI